MRVPFAPEIWEVHPQYTMEEGGVPVQIRGNGFPEDVGGAHGAVVVCKFGHTVVNGVLLSPNVIVAQAPPHPPGECSRLSCYYGKEGDPCILHLCLSFSLVGAVNLLLSVNGSDFFKCPNQFHYLPSKPREDTALSSESSDASHRNTQELRHSVDRHRKQD